MSKYGLELVRQIQPVSWKYNQDACEELRVGSLQDFSRVYFGVVAQDLAQLLPVAEFGAVSLDDNENLMVDYGQLIGPLISAVQELAKEVETLKEKLNDKTN